MSKFYVVLVSAVAVLFTILLVGAAREAKIGAACRDAGYVEVKVNWGGLGQAYCLKRVDQTDVVVSANSVERG